MKRTICILLSIGIMLLSACAPRATVDEVPSETEQAVPAETALPTEASTSSEPTPTAKPTAEPTATPVPTPTPEPEDGEKYDVKRERVRCRVDNLQLDIKETWKVNSPTESPDPAWVVESVDGDTVTYSKTDCGHVKHITEKIPCQLYPNADSKFEDYVYILKALEGYEPNQAGIDTWKFVSVEDGIVTYKRDPTCSEGHTINTVWTEILCRLDPESGNMDRKGTMMVHVTADEAKRKRYGVDEWTFEYMEGDFEVYSYLDCDHDKAA